jgi:hypothetical protein
MIRSLADKRAMLLLPLWLLVLLVGWQPPASERSAASPWLEAGPTALEPIRNQLLPTRVWIGREASDADAAGPDDQPIALSATAAHLPACRAPEPLLVPAAAPARRTAAGPFRARAPPLV